MRITDFIQEQNKLSNAFRFKDRITKDLTSDAVYKLQCGLCKESHYDECLRHLNIRIREHICISPLTKKIVEPKGSVVSDNFLLCSHSPSFDSFSVLAKENRKNF